MNIVNWAFTTSFCGLLISVSSAQAAPKNDLVTDAMLQSAYQELVLNNTPKAQAPTPQQQHKKKRAITVAKKQLKVRYKWGGTSPRRGFDCSGLIQYSFKKANISLPRTAASQYKETQRVAVSQMKQGDLIFFHTPQRKRVRVNHVGIYLGNNKFIHAPRRGKTVTIANLNQYWKRKIVGAGRV